jgi:hypothetical protein
MDLDLSDGRFVYHGPAKVVSLTRVRVIFFMQPGSWKVDGLSATLLDPAQGTHAADAGGAITADPKLAGLPALSFTLSGGTSGPWSLQIAEAGIPPSIATSAGGHTRIDPNAIADIGILCDYALQ